jgi:hypothetical protein
MTVRALAEALAELVEKHGDVPVTIWLPGSKIDLHQMIGYYPHTGEVLIEGNVREGSALG